MLWTLIFLPLYLFANIFAGNATKYSMKIKDEFARTKQCIRCHLDIYEEYKKSPHFNSTIYRDPVHKAIFLAHSKATGEKEYICAKCHAPQVKDKKISSMDANVTGYKEAISCAYCHRIEAIEHHAKANKNIISKKKGHYFGNRNPQTRSEYHTIDNTNIIHKNGDTCMGCHSHKQNAHGFVVCQTESNNTLHQNCITCHMPQVEGSLSDRVETPTHAYHGFVGVQNDPKKLSKYLHIELLSKNSLKILLKNDVPHAFLLHPLRMALLRVKVRRGEKEWRFEKRFYRSIGKEGKSTPPWVATQTIKDTMLQAGEKRVVDFDFTLKKGDRVEIEFGFYQVNPKIAKKFHLDPHYVVFKRLSLDV